LATQQYSAMQDLQNLSWTWAAGWTWTDDVRDVLGFQKPVECNEVHKDVTVVGSCPAESELGLAVRCGDISCVERLLSNSADANARDAWGQTTLFHAVNNGNLSIIALLLLAGADPTRTSDAGLSALDVADTQQAEALLRALAPVASMLAPDMCDLEMALDALPTELRMRFEEAMGNKRGKMAI